MVFFIFVFFCLSSLEPNEYGLLQNYLSGTIHSDVRRGGIFFTGPLSGFVKFPAAQMTMEFSSHSFDRPPVKARTGQDVSDPNSGGQQVMISCAFQYSFLPETLRDVYLSFGSFDAAKQRYLQLSWNMVGTTAQEFTPADFWTRRDVIAHRMLDAVNNTLWVDGKVQVLSFEIMKVEFDSAYEDTITNTQVAEQQGEIYKYEQQVQEVVQSISVMEAENTAKILNISSGAAADAKEIRAAATRDAFNLKQGTKAAEYTKLQSELGFDAKQMSEYFKIKALQGQARAGKLVVGVPGIKHSEL